MPCPQSTCKTHFMLFFNHLHLIYLENSEISCNFIRNAAFIHKPYKRIVLRDL
jgi:hypothetical protein